MELGEGILIPRILFAIVEGELSSFCVWPDAISTLIPKVDRLLIPRDQMVPKSWFKAKKQDTCLIRFAEALPLLEQYKVSEYGLEAYKLPSPVTPPAFKKFVAGLKPVAAVPEDVAVDQVLNPELVEKYQKQP